MSFDPALPDLQVIQDWIDQHPWQDLEPRSLHDDPFDFEHLSETEQSTRFLQAANGAETWENDANRHGTDCQTSAHNGACEPLDIGPTKNTTLTHVYDNGLCEYQAVDRGAAQYNPGVATWIPASGEVIESIEHTTLLDADGTQSISAAHPNFERRLKLVEADLKMALDQLSVVKIELRNFRRWAGHMSHVVNETQLCQQGFSPVLKTFGILLPAPLKPTQEDRMDMSDQ